MGDKVKANVQWCLQFIPPQRAVNYAEQARRHRQAGVNGERKLFVSPGSFPFSAQLTSSMSHRISGGACRGDSFAPICPAPGSLSRLRLQSLSPGAANPYTPQPVPDGCILLGCWMQRGRGAAQRSPKDLQIAHDVYFTSYKTFCSGFIYTRWLK